MEYLGSFLSTTNQITDDTDKIIKYFHYRPNRYDTPSSDLETIFDLKALSGFPQVGDLLEENNNYEIESIDIKKWVDDSNTGVKKVSYTATCTYDTSANIQRRKNSSNKDNDDQRKKYIDEDGHVVKGSTKPWKMKPTWTKTPIAVEVPFLKAYDSSSDTTPTKDVLNDAKCRIKATTTRYRFEISWKKAFNTIPSSLMLKEPFTNSADWSPRTISGEVFPSGTVLILPSTYELAYFENRDEKNKPTTYDPYFTFTVKLIYDPKGWDKRLLNVGKFAKFNGYEEPAEQIYSYRIKNSNSNNVGTLEFGNWAKIVQKQADPQIGAENVIYEKVSEELPLTVFGQIDMDAINDPVNNPYVVKSFIQYRSKDFSELPI